MEFNEIFQICIVPAIGIVIGLIVFFVKKGISKAKETTDEEFLQNCLDALELIVVNVLLTTQTTYIEALKNKDAGSEEAQKEALEKVCEAVISTLTDDVKEALSETINDLPAYIMKLIQEKINEKKED
jgi:flagellar basal body-associated protein FliL